MIFRKNKITFALSLVLALSLSSCAGAKNFFKRKKEKKSTQKKVIDYGPSLKTGTHFVDRAKDYGLNDVKAYHLYGVDFNRDGHTDLVVLPDYYSLPRFFEFSAKTKKFVEIPTPLPEGVRASYLTFADYNKDGVYDMLVGVLNQRTELTPRPLRLFMGSVKSEKVSYKEVIHPIDRTKVNPTSSVAIFDYDLDGQLDLYEANWFDLKSEPPELVPDRIFKGDPKIIKEVSYLLKGEHDYDKSSENFPNATPTFGVGTCDIDGNGYPDIMTSNSDGVRNKLWLNLYDKKNKDRIFIDYAKESEFAEDAIGDLKLKGGGNSFFATCTDYNNDGIMDVLTGELTRNIDSEERDRSSILTGSTFDFPPKFIRSEYYMSDGSLNWNQGDKRAVWSDFNNDGLIDVVVENSDFPPYSRMILFEQESDHAFIDMSKQRGVDIVNPSGVIVMDVNNDGLMDIVVGQSSVRAPELKGGVRIFINEQKNTNKSFRFYLRGKKANTHGISATIELISRNKNQKRWVEYINGPLPSQNEEGIHFGLPENDEAMEVVITWPLLQKGKPLKRKYKIKKSSSSYQEFSLYEDGKILLGRRP